MSRFELHLLGRPRAELDGEPVHIGRRKSVALLAYLAVTGRSHSRDALAALLWSEYDQSRARANLRRALSLLNTTLGEGWLAADLESAGLALDADPAAKTGSGHVLWLDVEQFRQRLAACETHGHLASEVCADCLSALTEAVALYDDDFMAGFSLPDSPAFDEWQFFQSEGLREEVARALERLAWTFCEGEEWERALPYARRWLAMDPLHEPAQRLLMRLYAGSGHRAAALRQYAECVRVLKEELGAPPDEATTKLYRAIKDKKELPPPGERPAVSIPSPAAAPKHNLPAQLTPFVGREALLAEIALRLEDPACRLLTLVGPGGSGKTRLALKAAEARLDANAYPHGVFFVSLAPLESVEGIVPAVAQAQGFRFYEGVDPRQQLLDYMRQKSLLLILDNFEHLLDPPPSSPPVGGTEGGDAHQRGAGGEALITEILKIAPQVKIMATSRVRLNVGGEHRFQVGGMDHPDAVKLFCQGARRAQPGFELTDGDQSAVLEVCHLVEGNPLGIRLAAAWTEMLSPAEIAAEISQSLDFLETDVRDAPERQRSMRAVFDHSWKLLTEGEREVLAALSVFRGGFARRAAQQVAGASLRELKGLVEKSLLHRNPGERYEVHELLRQYSAEKLVRSPTAVEAARDRHCAYTVSFLGRRAQDLKGARQGRALSEIEADSENARRAWNWAAEHRQVDRLDRALEGLFLFYQWRGRYQEGEAACQTAGERLEGTESGRALRIRARILTWQSIFNEGLGRFEIAHQLPRASLSLLDEPPLAGHDTRPERAFALQHLGYMASWSGDRQEVRRCYEESLALYRALGDRRGTAAALYGLGWLAQASGAYDEAEQVLGESLAIRRELGDRMGSATTLEQLASIFVYQGQLEEAERLAREIIGIGQELGDRASLALGLHKLGFPLIYLGRFAEARSALKESVVILDDLGSRGWTAMATCAEGFVEMYLGCYAEATVQGQRALTLARQLGFRTSIGYSLKLLGSIALAEGAYAEAQRLCQESVAVYRALEYPFYLSFALSALGAAAYDRGDLDQARAHLWEALQTAAQIRSVTALLEALPVVALLLAGWGDAERAVEIYALASHYPFVANSQWYDDVVGQRITAAAAGLPPDVVAAAQARGRARDLEAMVRELLEELEA